MSTYLYFYLLISFVLNLTIARTCEVEYLNSSLYFGTKTPYRIRENKSRNPYNIATECKPQQMWMFIRHGTRYPSTKQIELMNTRLPLLRDEILKKQNNGTLCFEDIERLRVWSSQVEPGNDQGLTHIGEDEMADLAERMLDRFPNLLDENYSNSSYKFRYTATQRTRQSANFFAQGLFGRRISRYVWYPEALSKDPVLRFYKLCKKWLTEVDETPSALQERVEFENSETFQVVRRNVAARLGLREITKDDLDMIYKTCAYETSWLRSGTSPWCVVFNETDFQTLEYAEDLEYYWNDGYGFDVTYNQACPPIQDMLRNFQMATQSTVPKGIFYFTHSGALLKVLAYLGLYRDNKPLLHSNFHLHRNNRQWRVGRINSFAANLATVLYSCGEEPIPDYRVLTLHQERIITLPGCPEHDLCPLKTLQQLYPDCTFDEICKISDTK